MSRNDPVTAPPVCEPEIRTIAMPKDTNPSGDIFGGWLMAQMDLAGSIVATRHARGRVATAAVNGMSFLKPVFVGDEVSLYAKLLKTGRTSITVAVEAWRRERFSEERIQVTEATFVYVAIDEQRQPRPVPV
ncbi:acyl-CoA thioesterase [Nitrococcus mobilis]|uniref:Cytosolic long-chain acyl-CoA thioester hydrolase family protein n=1 Tax=Nitrococcus mobilis Nb-231 TaxID=314278 RepID=A4BUH2_9GAMM|nr:acyl-CoA thioesterase [Nitrococcus mobilis]EAR20686.1 cytosolic long-chain acyl-CoA thioester hydrolase family protein [Nitrococcus mobilis Nb-231]